MTYFLYLIKLSSSLAKYETRMAGSVVEPLF